MSNSVRNAAQVMACAAFCFLWDSHSYSQKELILVSPHWEGIQYEFELAFKEHYRLRYKKEVRLRWRDGGGTSTLLKMLDAQLKATPGNPGVDVLFGGGTDPFVALAEKGHLEPYKISPLGLMKLPAEVNGVPLRDSRFRYYAAAISSFGIVENKRVREIVGLPEVRTWSDLANPELAGWVSAADPRKSGSVHMIYEIILQAYGWDRGWATIYGIAGNSSAFLDSSSKPVKEATLGNAAYAISIDINGMVAQNFIGPEHIRFFIPAEASILNGDCIAIFKGAPNRDVAEAFVSFVMSEKGQRLWMTPSGSKGGPVRYGISRMSPMPKLYQTDLSQLLVPMNPFQETTLPFYNSALGGKRWGIVNDIIGATMIDVHSKLKSAWMAAHKAGRLDLLAQLQIPPLTEAEAIKQAPVWKDNPIQARAMANQWMKEAVRYYDSIETKANASMKASKP